MKNIIIFCLFFLVFSTVAYCGQINRVELTDGSVINGEIISLANGIYVINAVNLGEIRVEAAKVSRIESVQPAGINSSGIDTYRQKLMSNPENTAIITGLAADPRIQEIAQDPRIQDAAKSGDIQALMKSEKFMNIVNDPKMQETMKKLKQ